MRPYTLGLATGRPVADHRGRRRGQVRRLRGWLSRESRLGRLRSSGCLGGGCLEMLIKQACLFSQQILDVVTPAHTGSGHLLIEKAMSHGRHAHCRRGAAILTEEVRLRSTLGARLLGCSWQSQRWLAGTLTNKHFNVVTIGHTRCSRLFLQQLAAKRGQIEGDRTRLLARKARTAWRSGLGGSGVGWDRCVHLAFGSRSTSSSSTGYLLCLTSFSVERGSDLDCKMVTCFRTTACSLSYLGAQPLTTVEVNCRVLGARQAYRV